MAISRPITRLVLVGACYIDTILSVPTFPQEDEKLRADTLERRRGGNAANTLEVLQQLYHSTNNPGLDLNLLCILPNQSSHETKFIRDSYGPDVSLSLCLYREAHSEAASSYIIRGMDKGTRTILSYNDLPEMEFDEFQSLIEKSQGERHQRTWYHFEGRIPATSVRCMRWLKTTFPDVIISTEAEKPARAGLENMAAEADVVFFAKGWAAAQGFNEVEEFLRVQAERLPTANLLCCTWGAEGAGVIVPKHGIYHHEPAYVDTGRQVVDTIGAGDTFIAGVLYQLLTSELADPKGVLQFASKLAGRKVLQNGFTGLVR